MKKLCAFIICAIISVCIGAHVVNTKNEVEEIKSTTNQTTEIDSTKIETEKTETEKAEGEKTSDNQTNDTTKPVSDTTSKPLTTVKSTTKVESTSCFYLSDYERSVVECVVMGEAGGETYEGQILVAQCLLNACLKDNLQPSKARTQYGYNGWNNNPSKSVKRAVSDVFDKGHKATDEPILYFYSTKYTTSSWHESQRFVCEVGDHRFFAEW